MQPPIRSFRFASDEIFVLAIGESVEPNEVNRDSEGSIAARSKINVAVRVAVRVDFRRRDRRRIATAFPNLFRDRVSNAVRPFRFSRSDRSPFPFRLSFPANRERRF
jgi:hypothetical protein